MQNSVRNFTKWRGIAKLIGMVAILISFGIVSAKSVKADINTQATPMTALVYDSATKKASQNGGFLNNKNYGALSPRVIELKHQANAKDNGRLLLTFEQVITNNESKSGKHPVFPIYESDDNGQTWNHVTDVSEPQNVHKDWGMMNCPQLYELPQKIGDMDAGTIVLAGDATPNDLSNTDLQFFSSKDLGRGWNYMSSIAKGGQNPTNKMGDDPVWEPYLMVYNNKLICYYSDETDNSVKAGNQKIVHKTTNDGMNWSNAVDDVNYDKLASGQSERPGMPTIAQFQDGQFAMTFEHQGYAPKGISSVKFTKDPENWNATTEGYVVEPKEGAPYITTLNNGKVVFNDTAYDRIFVFNSADDMKQGIAHATPYDTQLGHSYNRQTLALANGQLMIANGGNWDGNNKIRVETLNVGDTAQQGKVIIHYVDQDGKSIAPDDSSATGIVGTGYDVTKLTQKSVSGYQLKAVTNGQQNLTGNFGADPINITVSYQAKQPVPAPDNNGGNNSTTTPTVTTPSTSSTSTSSTNSSSNSQPAKPTSEVTKVKPFMAYAKRAVYKYDQVTFTRSARESKVAKGTAMKVVAIAKSANGVKRYKLSDGTYVTAKAFVAPLYLTKNVKKLQVINKHGVYEYKGQTFAKKNRAKHIKRGTTLKVKKVVTHHLTTRYQLTNGNYVTGNAKFVR
ncbi:DUF5776 domain-containing protein [Lentilactobacillus kisonensis]|uniref:MucBP domain protein n=1 Tax=Lentilactobacillus kisonensis F0435 TaxID=797516 RepID=H1LDM0_9LACO|nr:DUF5776 domain-containing protein [Lentilactobacillus kisonensis]EHO53130.1 MucBP domain protein [Lentilactobacillus kisonensis F0435]